MGQKSSQKWPDFLDICFDPKYLCVGAGKCILDREFNDVLVDLEGRTTFHFMEKIVDVVGS